MLPRAAQRELGPGQLGLATDEQGSLDHGRARGLHGQRRLPQHRDVQVGGVAVRGRAELVAQPRGQVVVRRQRRARPTVGDQRADERAHGLLVEGVGGDGLGGDPGGLGRLDRGEGVGEVVPRLAAQGVGLPADAQHPVGIVLVDEGRLAAEQAEG